MLKLLWDTSVRQILSVPQEIISLIDTVRKDKKARN